MSILKRTSMLAGALGLALVTLGPVQAQDKELTILESVPGLRQDKADNENCMSEATDKGIRLAGARRRSWPRSPRR